MEKPVHFSRHTLQQMIERGATDDEVLEAIRSGEQVDFIKICFDFRTAFCVSAKFGSYAARNMFP